MERARHVQPHVVPSVWWRETDIARRAGVIRRREVAQTNASPMDDGAPALDALQLGCHLDARKALDVFEREALFATAPHDTQLPGIWFEVGRQPLGAIN